MKEEKSSKKQKAYTDGSVTDAIQNGRGIYIKHPDGHRQTVAIPKGSLFTNYRTQIETLSAQ